MFYSVKVTFCFSCSGFVAAGHLQTQPEAATWTLLFRGIMHLLCIKGRKHHLNSYI